MAAKKETLLLLDGNALLHRAWHAIPPLTTKSGQVVNAAYGFTMVLEKILDQEKPDYMAVAWDVKAPTFRHAIYKEYKGHREEKAQELYDQIGLIQEILVAYGVPSFGVAGFEADDVIATLSEKAIKQGLKTTIVSGDLDLLQLVDETTSVLFFQKGISETKRYDTKAVAERYGLTPAQLVDYKALRGDPSDNIPGVHGIGEKGASELIQTFGSVDGILTAFEKNAIPEKFAKKLRGQEQVMKDARTLVTLVRTVPLDMRFVDAKVPPRDPAKIIPLLRDLEFRMLLRKYTDATPPPPLEAPAARVASKGTLAVAAVRQTADLFGATLSALILSDGKDTTVLQSPNPKQVQEALAQLRRADRVVVHDLKTFMYATGVRPDQRYRDLMLASYLLHSGSRTHDLASLAKELLDARVSEMASAESVALMPALADAAEQALIKAGMQKIYEEMELPLTEVLYEMEREGIELDVAALQTLSKTLGGDLERLRHEIVGEAGEEFNVNSPQQLAHILFETLKIPTKGIKKTKTGLSTAAPELEKLADAHPIISKISEYRELAKLQSTYVEALPQLVGKDGRVHTTFNQTVAATGRLSSSDPNLQNIPIKTELGRKIRRAFVAGRGKRLVSADYSQIELRLVAVLAKDQAFINAFRDGADIHTRTASEVWEVEEEKVTKDQRRAAKAINFGIIYGMGPHALARSTKMSFRDAQDFIDRYFEIHHAVRNFLDATKLKAHTEGYVETMFGRRRYFPEINSGVPMLVAAAERMAINMPVQGSAADIIKKAMLAVHGWILHSDWPVKMLLQVHDELVLECNHDAVDAVARGVRDLMQGVAALEVPLVVDVEVGKNWGEMKRFDEV